MPEDASAPDRPMAAPDDLSPLDPPRELGAAPVLAGPGHLRRFAQRIEFDRAVFYALAARAWQMLSGPVTVILIATRFSKELQSDYYAFGSLLAVQALFELNLSVVLLNAAGHEWPQLRLDGGRVAGDPEAVDRLAALDRFGTRWYGVAALLCLVGVGLAGHWMFRELPAGAHAAWAAAVTACSAMLVLLPRMAILQGCHQVEAVNRNVAAQAVCGTLTVWACIVAGLGLWAVAASWLVRLALDAWLVFGRYGTFFRSLRARPAPAVRWSTEIWPLQWRLALQAIASAAATSSFVLSLYQLSSQEQGEAGEMGMTLSVLNMFLWGGLAWMQTRVPVLAGHSRRGDRREYDRVFLRVCRSTGLVVGIGVLCFFALIVAMRAAGLPFAGRFLGTAAFATMAAAIVTQHLLNCLTIYARTRQREPFLVPGVALNLAIAAGVWLAAPPYGQFGVAAVYAALLVAVGLPVWLVIWNRDRRSWP